MGRGKTGCADDSYAEVTWLRKAPTLSDRAKGQAPGSRTPRGACRIIGAEGGNQILTKTGKDPVMQRDRQTLTAFGGIAAILIGSAMLLDDAAVTCGPITAIIGGIAASALAGLDRLKQRVATSERHLIWASQPASGGRRAIRPRRQHAADRAVGRPGMRRGRRSQPCRRALVAWSSPARAKPRS